MTNSSKDRETLLHMILSILRLQSFVVTGWKRLEYKFDHDSMKWEMNTNGFRRKNADKNNTNNADSNLEIAKEEKVMNAYRKAGYRKGIDIDLVTPSTSKGNCNLSLSNYYL